MNESRTIITRVFTISLITAIPCTILLIIYFATSPRIAKYHEIKLKKSVLDVFDITYKINEKQFFGFSLNSPDKEDIKRVFKENITIEELSIKEIPDQPMRELHKDKKEEKLFKYYKEGKLEGTGFVVTKFGYGFNKAADISLFLCVAPDQETIKGLEVLDHSETPGLGGRMTDDEFRRQFIGKKLRPKLSFVRGRESMGNSEVHAITGASYSSKGLETMINEAMETFWQEIEVKRE
jgi:Na+-translocating ferredoxin:NAD+ oxidoreductase RnfG subunit